MMAMGAAQQAIAWCEAGFVHAGMVDCVDEQSCHFKTTSTKSECSKHRTAAETEISPMHVNMAVKMFGLRNGCMDHCVKETKRGSALTNVCIAGAWQRRGGNS